MAWVIVNGIKYEGKKISIVEGIVYVDGEQRNYEPIPGNPSMEITDPDDDCFITFD